VGAALVASNVKLAAIVGAAAGAAAALLLIFGGYGVYRLYTARRVAVAPTDEGASGRGLREPIKGKGQGSEAAAALVPNSDLRKKVSKPVFNRPEVPLKGNTSPLQNPESLSKPATGLPASSAPQPVTASHVAPEVAVITAAGLRRRKSSGTDGSSDVKVPSGPSVSLAPLRQGGRPAPDPTELLIGLHQQSPRELERSPKSPPVLQQGGSPHVLGGSSYAPGGSPYAQGKEQGGAVKGGLASKPTFKQSDLFSQKLSEMESTVARKREAEPETVQRKGGSGKALAVDEDQMSQLVRGK
jgi:hypothetical protein